METGGLPFGMYAGIGSACAHHFYGRAKDLGNTGFDLSLNTSASRGTTYQAAIRLLAGETLPALEVSAVVGESDQEVLSGHRQ